MASHLRETQRYTRLSFWYPLSYLVPGSLMLVFAPGLADHFSNGHYSIFALRLVGAAMTGFTILVLNVFVQRVERLYNAVIYVRLPVAAIVAWTFVESRDPLFLILFLTVMPGVFFSLMGKWADRRVTAQLSSVSSP